MPLKPTLVRVARKNPRIVLFLAAIFSLSLLMNQYCYSSSSWIVTSESGDGFRINITEPQMILSTDDPIEIDGNAALMSEATFTGGKYYIENKVITSAGLGEHGIEIRNTDLPFIIRNCSVTGITDEAILLSNVSHCYMRSNNVSYNEDVGLSLSWVFNVTIVGDDYNYNWHGVDIVQFSSNVTLRNSTIEGNSQIGLYVDSSSYDNSVYWNAFDANFVSVEDHEPSKSNLFNASFYSDYTGEDLSPRDKFGDTLHIIDGSAGSIDNFPMTLPPDRLPVYWKVTPTDQICEYGYGFTYQLNASIYGGLKEWTINHTYFDISENGLITENRWLAIGEYGIEVGVSNTYNDVNTSSFSLTVQDTLYPTWDEEPEDQISEAGEDFRYDLNASDFSVPLLYYLESTPNFTIDAAEGIIINNSSLGFDVFMVKVHVRDTEGHITNATFTVTVEDHKSPYWVTEPEEQTVEFGYSFSYGLSASDYSGLDTWIVNNSLFQIDGTGLLSNATFLPVGDYPIEVSVNDTIGNVFTDVVFIHVTDTKSPSWITWPSDKTLEFGEALNLQLDAWDLSGILYWTISDTTHFDITTEGLVMSIGTLEQISYILSVRANDPYGNFVSAGFSVTVQDTLAPMFMSPLEDHTFELGNQIRMPIDVYDPSGLTGWSIEETTEFNIDSTGMITNVTSLHAGSYLIHLSVSDLIGHLLEGTFWVYIEDTTAPTWMDYPEQLNVTAPESVYYELQVYDLSGIDRWELNDTAHFVVDSEGHLVSRGTLSAGSYGLTITAFDAYGNNATIIVEIHAFTLFEVEIVGIIGAVGLSAILLAGLVVLTFDPKRGRYGAWHKEGK